MRTELGFAPGEEAALHAGSIGGGGGSGGSVLPAAGRAISVGGERPAERHPGDRQHSSDNAQDESDEEPPVGDRAHDRRATRINPPKSA